MIRFVKIFTIIIMVPIVILISIFSNLKELLESNRSDFSSTSEFAAFIILSPFVFPYAVGKTTHKALAAGVARLKD